MNRYCIDGCQHIGIPTDCFQATLRFYGRLGCTNVHQTAMGDGQVAFLQLGSLMLEVYEQPTTARMDGAVDHFALNCTDIETAYRNMEEDGFVFLTDGVQSIPAFWDNGIKYFIVEGPNKERVELCQIL